jgi:hypothetical protein
VHCSIDQSRVVVVATNISWTIKPIDPERIYTLFRVVLFVDQFHDATQVVWFPGRLAYEIHLV